VRVGGLFSGIGGLELGLEWAGMQTAWQVERDPYACRVLAKHWPDVPRYDDVTTFQPATAAPVDLLCGGFPCQPHSLAGRRLASGDERDLWGHFARVIREAQPKWVVAENVPGLLSSEGGRYFGRVLADLAALGFDAEWFCFSAKEVGAPHRRDRVFIVAHANSPQRKGDWRTVGVPAKASSGSRGQQEDVTDASSKRRQGCGNENGLHGAQGAERNSELARGGAGIDGWWASEPDVGRVAHGVPARVDRLRCLGNAVVPQVAYEIGRRIMTMEATHG
jgi:DNA (cytosine-5)-methyltransferase 1